MKLITGEKKAWTPMPTLSDLFTKVDGEANLEIGKVIYFQMTIEFLKVGEETSGLFAVRDGQVVWVGLVASVNQHSHTQAGGQAYNDLTMKCLNETGEVPTGQWHTHPNQYVFWSVEDTGDQIKTVQNGHNFNPVEGEMWFMVVDLPEVLLRRFFWENSGPVCYQDGVGVIGGQRAEIPHPVYNNWFQGSGGQAKGLLVGDEISFRFEGKTLYGTITELVSKGEKKGQLLVYAYQVDKNFYVPREVATLSAKYETGNLDLKTCDEMLQRPGLNELEFVEGKKYLFRDYQTGNDAVGKAFNINYHMKACDMETIDGIIDSIWFNEIIQEVNE